MYLYFTSQPYTITTWGQLETDTCTSQVEDKQYIYVGLYGYIHHYMLVSPMWKLYGANFEILPVETDVFLSVHDSKQCEGFLIWGSCVWIFKRSIDIETLRQIWYGEAFLIKITFFDTVLHYFTLERIKKLKNTILCITDPRTR